MAALNNVEAKLDELLVKKAPVQLPENARTGLVQWLPWLALVFGVLQLLAAWWLWDWGHKVNTLVDYTNGLTRAFGGGEAYTAAKLGVFFWVALVVLVIDGVLMLVAYPGLKQRIKKGWNLLFWAALLNVVYGVVSVLTDRGSVGSLLTALLGSLVGLYLLFQVRGYYADKAEAPVALEGRS